jgi:hypothetical protein
MWTPAARARVRWLAEQFEQLSPNYPRDGPIAVEPSPNRALIPREHFNRKPSCGQTRLSDRALQQLDVVAHYTGSLGRRRTRRARDRRRESRRRATVVWQSDHRLVQNVPLDRARPRLVGAPRDGPGPVADCLRPFAVLVRAEPLVEVRAGRADGARSLDGPRVRMTRFSAVRLWNMI